MCGIAGFIGHYPLEQERIDRCLNLMKNRGPDFSDCHTAQVSDSCHVALLHSRLRIIDLDKRSNQPFHYGSQVLAYNGEVYNYLELRAALEKSGSLFATASDTEVLAAVLDKNGWQGLDKCEGMWAFASLDIEKKHLLLGRDRFGEKPLYYVQSSRGLYFGSEIKFIQALIPWKLEPDFDQLCRFLVNGYKAVYKSGQNFFKEVRELRGGDVLIWDSAGNETRHAYWRPRYVQDAAMTYEEALAGVKERLMRAIEIRLRADVPLSVCLSGGIDSNSLIGIARNEFNYQLHAYTIVNEDKRYEENDFIDLAVREMGIKHTAIPTCTDNFLSNLRKLVRYHDAPVYTISYYAHWLLMKSIAEQGYRVNLRGTGADEIFSGYYDHHLAYLHDVKNQPALHGVSLSNWERIIKPHVRNPYLNNPNLFIENRGFRDHIILRSSEFSSYLTHVWEEPFAEIKYSDDLLRTRMLNEMFYEAVPVLLHEEDLNAMHFSIESRAPYLDRALFEFCQTVPTKHLVRDGLAKSLLRDAGRGYVPDQILNNPRKVGFNAPIFDFLDKSDKETNQWLLNDSPVYELVHKEPISELFSQAHLQNSHSKFLFYFINCKMFLEEFAS